MKFIIYEDQHGEFRWRAKASNGYITADSGEGYQTRNNADRAAKRFKKINWADVPIIHR